MVWQGFRRKYWRDLFNRRRLEQDLDEEIKAHLEIEATRLIDNGASPEEARTAALREMRSIAFVKEATRETWIGGSFGRLGRDLRYAWRLMRRTPILTTVVILSLALGIGANTATFSLLNSLMLRSLPVHDPKEIVEMLSQYPGEQRLNGFKWKYFEYFRDNNHAFSNLVGVAPNEFEVSVAGSPGDKVDGEYVTGDFFPTLGIKPEIGRMIGPGDDRIDDTNSAVAVLSWSYWRNRFNQDPSIIGKQITVNGVPATVIGVGWRDFFGIEVGKRRDLWVPVAMESLIRHPSARSSGDLQMNLLARLKHGTSLDQARAELRLLDQWRVADMSAGNKDPLFQKLTLYVEPAGNGLARIRDQFSGALTILMAVVGILLLIACANIAGLLLVRGFSREQEMALRISLGVGRYGLVKQVLTESLLLSSIGAAIGIILAKWGVDALVQAIMSTRTLEPISIRVETDWHVLVFTTTTALLAGFLFSLAPALHVLKISPASSLRQIGRVGETKSGRSLGKSLLITQVALSMVLLSGAALFTKQLSKLRYEDLGFRRDSVLLVGLDPSRSGLKRAQLSAPYKEILDQLKAIPGVLSVTLCNGGPIQAGSEAHFAKIEGYQEKQDERRYIMFSRVAPKYFETLGMALISGRDFELEDETRSRVAIVNEAMAHRYFGAANPLSKHFTFDGDQQTYEIVGVTNDAKYSDLAEVAPPTIYLNAFQGGRMSAQTVALRTRGAPSNVAADVRRLITNTVKAVTVDNVTTLGAQIDASIVPERLITALAQFFGSVGALLSVLGVYGLVSYNVTRRINEFGVRKAMGATRIDVIRMVLQGVLGTVGTGLLIGSVLAFWTKRYATSFIAVQVDDTSPIAFAAMAMIAVTMIAAYLPARQAAHMEPMDALRHE